MAQNNVGNSIVLYILWIIHCFLTINVGFNPFEVRKVIKKLPMFIEFS